MNDILTHAMTSIAKHPDDFEAIKIDVAQAIRKAVARDRRKIETSLRKDDWGRGELATHEILGRAIGHVHANRLPFTPTPQARKDAPDEH